MDVKEKTKLNIETLTLWQQRTLSLLGTLHILNTIFRYSNLSTLIDVFKELESAFFFINILIFVFCFISLLFSNKGDIKNRVKTFWCKEQILLGVFFVIVVLSVLVTMDSETIDILKTNFEYVYDLFICIFVLFPLGRYWSTYRNNKYVEQIVFCFITSFAILMAAILTYIIIETPIYTGEIGEIGIDPWSYHLCINCNPNMLGIYMAIFLMVSIIGVLKYNAWKKCIMLGNTVVYFIVLALSNSRGSYLSTTVSICIIIALIVYKKLLNRIIIVSSVAIISFIILQYIKDFIFFVFDTVSGYSDLIGKDANEIVRDLNITKLSGRGPIWENSIKAIFYDIRSVLIGVSPAEVINKISLVSDGEITMYTHNQFLEVGVSVGIPGLAVFITWLICTAKLCVRLGLADNSKVSLAEKVIPLMILQMMINNMVEARLLYHGFLCGSIFFLICGWVCQYKKRK